MEGVFSLCQLATCWLYGSASDTYGRRPILALGLIGSVLSLLGLGLARSFVALVFFRALAGVFSGNIAVSMSVISEVTNEAQMKVAFGWMPIVWALGGMIGAALGGGLSHLEKTFPSLEGTIIAQRPFMLCFFAAALFPLISLFLVAFVIKETLPPERRRPLIRKQEHAPMPPLLSRKVVATLCGLLAFVAMSVYTRDTAPLFFVTPVPYGLDLSNAASATLIASRGIATTIFQLTVYPAIAGSLSMWSLTRAAILIRTFTILVAPVFGAIRAHYSPLAPRSFEWVRVADPARLYARRSFGSRPKPSTASAALASLRPTSVNSLPADPDAHRR